MQTVRNELSNSIKLDNVDQFFKSIRGSHKTFLPRGAFDWNSIENTDKNQQMHQIKTLIRAPGFTFPGTDECCSFLTTHSRFFTRKSVGLIVFTKYGMGFTQIYPDPKKTHRKYYLLLMNHNAAHWTSASVQKSNKLKTRVLSISDVQRIWNT